jgi:hypothetical protein
MVFEELFFELQNLQGKVVVVLHTFPHLPRQPRVESWGVIRLIIPGQARAVGRRVTCNFHQIACKRDGKWLHVGN